MLSTSGNCEVTYNPPLRTPVHADRWVHRICWWWWDRNVVQLNWSWLTWHTSQLLERWKQILDEKLEYVRVELSSLLLYHWVWAIGMPLFYNPHIKQKFTSLKPASLTHLASWWNRLTYIQLVVHIYIYLFVYYSIYLDLILGNLAFVILPSIFVHQYERE